MANLNEIRQYKHIHMLGIGGTSMSGIAVMLKTWGIYVTGSDASESELVNELRDNGIKVTIGHDIESLRTADLIVYTATIPKTDVEYVEAINLRIPIMERSEFLGLITKAFPETVAFFPPP